MRTSHFLKTLLIFSFIFFSAAFSFSESHPPIEAYGERPEIDHVTLSGSGQKVAIAVRSVEAVTATIVQEGRFPPKIKRALRKIDEGRFTYHPTKLVVHDLKSGTTQSIIYDDYDDIIDIDFVGDDYVLITQRRAAERVKASGKKVVDYHSLRAMIWHLKDNEIKQFFFEDEQNDEPIDRRQLNVTGLVALTNQTNEVYVQAIAQKNKIASLRNHLLKANLDSGAVTLEHEGDENTIDWIVRPDGQLLAREDYNNRNNTYRIVSEQDGTKSDRLKLNDAKRPPFLLVGAHSDRESLVILAGNEFDYLAVLKSDGSTADPLLQEDGKDIDYVFVDRNRVVQGVKYSGVSPSYQFFDTALNVDIQNLISEVSGSSVTISGHSSDWQKILLKLEGGFTSGMYVLFDRATQTREMISEVRPSIPPAAIGESLAFNYSARDGLKIEAIVTLPPKTDLANASGLKAIVMPHGGPEAYDSIGFDWMAQYFANRGYLVLQPNFRGSAGYGRAFVEAGNGEWGGKMQNDLSDGLEVLVDAGLVDPERVCIVGASYGGYAALAGGAFTPELYQCVVAIAPVSDLGLMLKTEKRDRGRAHWVIDYWEERMSDGQPRTKKLNQISPRKQASKFQAPVLLLHGDEDSVVPIKQSEIMRDALKRAGKSVEFIVLKGADHWLSQSPTRLAALEAASAFVEQHLGQ